MGNIVDYIKEYGKFSLEDRPFNEVDSLIMSQFSYLKFDTLIESLPDNEKILDVTGMRDNIHYNDLFLDERYEKVNRELYEAMADSVRFSKVRLYDYVNIIDAMWEIQFSAVTFVFENGFIYVAFRGTDDSISRYEYEK